MNPLYREDLAYIQAAAFGKLATSAAPEIVRRLTSAAIPIRRVVDVGCGAGPLTVALVAEGFEVTGIDVSADLLARARAAAPSAAFIQASAYDVELPPCEAIVAVGEPLTYDAEEALVESFFQRAADVLPAGGKLIFDIIELGQPPLNGRFWSSGDDWAVLSETVENQAARTLVRTIETFRLVGQFYRRRREVHRVRLFDSADLCARLAERGFWVETSRTYGALELPARRRAFFCTRL